MTEEQRFRLAAKACGKDLTGWEFDTALNCMTFTTWTKGDLICGDFINVKVWNPRDEDGDSRRLQADCGMTVCFYNDKDAVEAHLIANSWADEFHFAREYYGTRDKYAATRLAVLNCAVVIGGAMG